MLRVLTVDSIFTKSIFTSVDSVDSWQFFFKVPTNIFFQKVEGVDSWQFFTRVPEHIFFKKLTVLTVDSFFQHFYHNNDTRSTMPEPAKDTAIQITPKPQASSVRVPRKTFEKLSENFQKTFQQLSKNF